MTGTLYLNTENEKVSVILFFFGRDFSMNLINCLIIYH